MDNSIVISGMSGRLPECDNVKEFMQKLLDGLDLVTDDDRRYPAGIYNLPPRTGKLNDISHFDAKFFGVPPKQAHIMDPGVRIVLEVAHEAIVDAGINPNELRGTNTGVFIGSFQNEAVDYSNRDAESINGYGLLGGARTILSSRISYAFDFHGPSYAVDSACSSSLMAFQQAYDAVKMGRCDAALAGGVNLVMNPNHSLQFFTLGVLSPDGKCKSFDESANGYVRSEAIGLVFMQRYPNSKRVYAKILGARSNADGYKKNGLTHPSGVYQKQLITELYNEIKLDPREVVYIEAHGTGTKAGDPQELNAIVDVFCKKGRNAKLMIGSVKTSIGHSEPSSGVCSLIKLILSMEYGILPANLHYNNPTSSVPGLHDGTLHVIDKHTKWNGGIVAVNSFGFGGTNSHAVLNSHNKTKTNTRRTKFPRLVTVSGTTEEAVAYFLDNIKNTPYDEELYALIDNIHRNHIAGHEFKGFCLVGDTKPGEVKHAMEKTRPVWYVFSGMGSQCANIGIAMMALEPFRKSIEQSASVLKTVGVDLKSILVDDNSLDSVLNSFITITSVQIALVDTLKVLGITPDGIIGHSLGEVACGYADGTITSEQTILISYYRAIAFMESKTQNGAMAAIGLSWEECGKLLPNGIDLACNNSLDNVTVSGPKQSIQQFVQHLTDRGIFAKTVNSSGFAFHSQYVDFDKTKLKAALDKLIAKKHLRTPKWISTSTKKSDWGVKGTYSDTDYYINNLVSPVYFHEATQMILEDAVIVEISPHCVLQSILKRSLPKSVTNIGLLRNDNAKDVNLFLSNIGRIYLSGVGVNVAAIYPPVEFPVSKGTPMISHMIKWNHSTEWEIPDFVKNNGSSELAFEVDLNKEEYEFLSGHVIDGKLLFPGSAYMLLVWRAFANLRNQKYEQVPVVFEDLRFLRTTLVTKARPTRFLVNILNFSGEFEISENNAAVAKGKISLLQDVHTPSKESGHNNLRLKKEDIYKLLRLKGFEHQGLFQGLNGCGEDFTSGVVSWEGNWITFIDCMLQFNIMEKDIVGLQLPTGIEKAVIDTRTHPEMGEIGISINKEMGSVACGGVELRGIKGSAIAKRKQPSPNLEKYAFVPFVNNQIEALDGVLSVVTQLVAENSGGAAYLKIAEVLEDKRAEIRFLQQFEAILKREPHFHLNGIVISENENLQHDSYTITKALTEPVHLIVYSNALNAKNVEAIQKGLAQLKPGGFVLFEESSKNPQTNLVAKHLNIISQYATNEKSYVLTRKPSEMTSNESVVIEMKYEDNFDWMEPLKNAMDASGTKIYLVSHAKHTGILGLLTCLRREPGAANIRGICIQDEKPERFSLQSNFYKTIIAHDLAQNVYKNNTWGNYHHVLFEPEVRKDVEYAYVEGAEWIEGKLSRNRMNGMCSVCFGALNNDDVLLANGRKYESFCAEFSGRDHKGRRVMGLVCRKGLATKVAADDAFLWDVPEKWSLKEACTIPMAYTLSYYALLIRGQLEPDECVFINNGCSPIGLAAISIALKMSCKIFTTINNHSERDILTQQFPQLTKENILTSSAFERAIMAKTRGLGVDLVLNQMKGQDFAASLRCLSRGGRFLELLNNAPQENWAVAKKASFHSVSANDLLLLKRACSEKIARFVREGVASGTIRPLMYKVFDRDQLELALKYLQGGDSARKVLIKIRDDNEKIAAKINAIARSYMHPEKVYVVIGGLGGFGLELTNWLMGRGARNIVLSSRSPVKSGYQSLCLKRWKDQGVNVHVFTGDVANIKQAKELFNKASSLGAIGGIFNLAVVLRDAMFRNQNASDFKLVNDPKLTITRNMDQLSRTLAPDLEYFVCFSSASCGRGNVGQGTYGFANSAMERLCEERHSHGLPALAVQWGQIGDVGLVADKLRLEKTEVAATIAQKLTSCLATLDTYMQQSVPIVSSMIVAEKKKEVKTGEKKSLTESVADILGISMSKVSGGNALSDMGMDSIMSVEIKQMMEKDFNLDVTMKEIIALTFSDLIKLEANKGKPITNEMNIINQNGTVAST